MNRRLAALLAWLVLPGCVAYVRSRIDDPVDPAAVGALAVGTADLGQCLQALGAPHRVFPHQQHGLALLWVWNDADDIGLDVSVPASENINVSFDLDLTDSLASGCMLWFDPALRLRGARFGTLGDLLPDRPQPLPDDGGPAGG